jgi:hypothetical protein
VNLYIKDPRFVENLYYNDIFSLNFLDVYYADRGFSSGILKFR